MLQHSVNKEAVQLFCKAVQARAEDGKESDNWTDAHGASMQADRWWFQAGPVLVRVRLTSLALSLETLMGRAWVPE